MSNQAKAVDLPGTLVFVVSETLTDGSNVYNVILGDQKWHAVDQGEAQELAWKISGAINDHTVDVAAVVDETE